jgi:hypothetical protein
MRYFGKWTEKASRDTIGNSQIRRTLNQEPVTKVDYRREPRYFGHLIGMYSNQTPRQVWEKWLRGHGEEEGQG